MRYALCVMRYALCVMRYALCVMRYAKVNVEKFRAKKSSTINCEAIKVGDPDGTRTRDHLRDRQVF